MKNLVSARGFTVGMTGEVRYDRAEQAFRIDDSVSDAARRELETLLAPYMTEDARQRARSIQYDQESANRLAEDKWMPAGHGGQDRASDSTQAWPSLAGAADPAGIWRGWTADAGPKVTPAPQDTGEAVVPSRAVPNIAPHARGVNGMADAGTGPAGQFTATPGPTVTDEKVGVHAVPSGLVKTLASQEPVLAAPVGRDAVTENRNKQLQAQAQARGAGR